MKKVTKTIGRVEIFMAAGCLVISTTLIVAAAILRSLGSPINWSVDMSLFFFAWCIFLSADVALRDDRLVSFDMIADKLPQRFRKALCTLIFVIILVFLGLLAVYGSILAYTTRIRSFQGIPWFSYTWITLSMPVGALLMMYTVINKIIGFYRKNDTAEEIDELIADGEDE